MVCYFAVHCLLVPQPRVCRSAAPHVPEMECRSWLSALVQWSLFNGLAARECSFVCMSEVDSCFVHGLSLGFVMFSSSTAACLFLDCMTCGWRDVLPLPVRLWTNGHLPWVHRRFVSCWHCLCHALCMYCGVALHRLLVPQPRVCRLAA